jgi:quercetin dioxygenase-like cupin family protein
MKNIPPAHSTWPGPEAEVPIDPWYEKLIEAMQEWRRRAETGLVVIRGKEIPWWQNRQGRVRYFLLPPYKTDTALQTIAVFERIIFSHSGMHRHQGGLAIYVLDGEGYSTLDGERFDWATGDLLLLPIKPGGVAHQHFNRDPDRPARWLAFIPMAFQEYLGSELVQLKVSPDWPLLENTIEKSRATGAKAFPASAQNAHAFAEARQTSEATLLDSLFKLRDDYRRQSQSGLKVVRGRDLPWEHNRQGIMRWYLHPDKRDVAIRSLLVYIQEIPPAGRSGRQRCPGGLVHFILEGHGAVEVDGVRYEWEAGDCVALPIKSLGVEYQFFNLDAQNPARYLAATPNFFEVLGVDLGSSFEQLEDASD